MENKNFTRSISVNMPAEEVIKKVGNVTDWWGITFNGNSHKLNDTFVVKMGGESFFNFTITELDPHKKLVWSVTDCHMPWFTDKKEWAGTKIIFELSENNKTTTLNFTHQGLTPQVECYKDCEFGWNHWITHSLFSYLTTGKGDFNQH